MADSLNKENSDFLIFLNNRLNNNLVALEKYLPHIAEKFKNYTPNKSIDIFCTSLGIPNVIFGDRNKAYYETDNPIEYCKQQIEKELSSSKIQTDTYDYQEDLYGQIGYKYLNRLVEIDKENKAQNEIQPNITKSVATCLIIGAGLGYHLAELYERIEIFNAILIEPDPDVFFASLHTFDWKNLLEYVFSNNLGFEIIIGCPNNLLHQIEEVSLRNGEFLLYNRLFLIHRYDNNTLNVMQYLMDYKNILFRSGFFDDILFGACHTIKSIQEQRKFVNKNEKLGELENLPVFIIGSGPSVDNDLKFIQRNQDKAIIIACGTALDVLYHSGIKPDFYACTERLPEIIQSLKAIPDQNFFDEIILLSTNVCHPYTVGSFKHEALFNKDNEPIITFLKMNIEGLDWMQDSSLSNPFVGNAGVSGAIYLGFKRLYLFGIDCGKAITLQRNHSPKATLYNQYGFSDKGELYEATMVAKGNLSDQVHTNWLFLRSAKNIDDLLVKHPDVCCFNCSDGVKIEHAFPIESVKLTEEFSLKKEIDKIVVHNFITKKKTSRIQIPYEQIQNLFIKDRFDSLCKEITNRFQTTPIFSRGDVVKLFMDISRSLYNKRNEKDIFYANLIEDSLQSFFIMVLHSIYGVENQERSLSIAKQMIIVIQNFLTEASELFDKFPDYVMGKHRKYYPNGKLGKDMSHCSAPDFPEDMILLKNHYHDPIKKFKKITK